jgi:hypothetical protein
VYVLLHVQYPRDTVGGGTGYYGCLLLIPELIVIPPVTYAAVSLPLTGINHFIAFLVAVFPPKIRLVIMPAFIFRASLVFDDTACSYSSGRRRDRAGISGDRCAKGAHGQCCDGKSQRNCSASIFHVNFTSSFSKLVIEVDTNGAAALACLPVLGCLMRLLSESQEWIPRASTPRVILGVHLWGDAEVSEATDMVALSHRAYGSFS